MYYEVGIQGHHAGFGMYQVNENNGEGWVHEQDLLDEMTQNVHDIWEIGGPEPLPADAEDIRGRIYGEPDRVFAFRYTEHSPIEYTGILRVEEE